MGYTGTCTRCFPRVEVKAKTMEELREKQREHDRKFHKIDIFSRDLHAEGYSRYAPHRNGGFYF